jgi:hypothetical protein
MSNLAYKAKFYVIDHAPHFGLVADTNVIVFVAPLLHSLGQPRGKARSGLRGLDCGMESGWTRMVCTSVIWFVERCLDVGTIVVKGGTIEVLVHLACGVHLRKWVMSPADLQLYTDLVFRWCAIVVAQY